MRDLEREEKVRKKHYVVVSSSLPKDCLESRIFEEGVVNYVSSDWTEGEVKLNRAVDEEAKPNFKFYSTEKAAQEYIKWNKPMYSLKDIDEAASPSRTDMFKKLIDLNRK